MDMDTADTVIFSVVGILVIWILFSSVGGCMQRKDFNEAYKKGELGIETNISMKNDGSTETNYRLIDLTRPYWE